MSISGRSACVTSLPPLLELADDRDTLLAQTEEQIALFVSGDRVGAWRKFMVDARIHMPEEVFLQYFGALTTIRNFPNRPRQSVASTAGNYATRWPG